MVLHISSLEPLINYNLQTNFEKGCKKADVLCASLTAMPETIITILFYHDLCKVFFS